LTLALPLFSFQRTGAYFRTEPISRRGFSILRFARTRVKADRRLLVPISALCLRLLFSGALAGSRGLLQLPGSPRRTVASGSAGGASYGTAPGVSTPRTGGEFLRIEF
jgi:hypothetical protein